MYLRVLIISLLIHVVLAIVISLMPAPPRPDLSRLSYVDLIEKPELPARPKQQPRDLKQFVRSTDVPDELMTNERKDARFASEEERFVIEERKARNNDLTKNRAMKKSEAQRGIANGRGSKLDFRPTSPLERARQELLEGRRTPGAGDIEVGGLSKPQPQASAAKGGRTNGSSIPFPSVGSFEQGISTLGEDVPDDIKFGDLTALNTDRHLFYTYYARMEEKIRGRWVNYARAAVYNLPASAVRETGKENWITKLEVILDPKGHFVKAILHESSGMRSLDSAPVQAFRDAGQFPNPPAEMVKDGEIHIYYAFNVSLGGSQYAGRGED